jgi:uncharacterized protein YggU (UPF0235/DUF167 family)
MVSDDGALVLKIHEPPVDGKANKARRRYRWLPNSTAYAKSSVRIVSGETSRTKRVEIPDGAELKKLN